LPLLPFAYVKSITGNRIRFGQNVFRFGTGSSLPRVHFQRLFMGASPHLGIYMVKCQNCLTGQVKVGRTSLSQFGGGNHGE
jgi:hypothetical protein